MAKYATYGHSIDLGGLGASIADTAAAYSQVHEIDRDLEITSVTFEADTAMVDAGDHVTLSLVRVRGTTELTIYTLELAADTVAWTPVTLAAVAAAYSKALAGDRYFAKIANETAAAVVPGPWHLRVGFMPGIEAATTESTYA